LATGGAVPPAGPHPVRGRAQCRVDVGLWVALVLVTGWAALRLTGEEPVFRWSQVVSFTPYAALVAGVVLMVALASRRWRMVPAALVAVAMFAVILLPRVVPDPNPPTAGPALRIMTLNMWNGKVEVPAVMTEVRRLRPDVLLLQEYAGWLPEQLDAERITDVLPYRFALPGEDAYGVAIYSRHPLSEGRRLPGNGPWQAAAVLTMPGGLQVEVVSVHACAPSFGWRTACWLPSIRDLPKPGGRLRILAGDFNATLDHAVLRELIATGYRDAADVAGKGLTMTWPYHEQPFFVPKIAIDHVLTDERIAIRDFEAITVAMDDHRITVTDLTLP
jgi:endonuclease/exonuclease/phosphatase (EEP) superfamily protein YafD